MRKFGVLSPLFTVNAISLQCPIVYHILKHSVIFVNTFSLFTGPEVTLGLNHINFMQLDEGRTATRTLDIINISNVEAIYQVLYS